MEFKIRWAGYGAEDDTWEPYSEVRDNDILHAFLRANKMKALIPTKHKNNENDIIV